MVRNGEYGLFEGEVHKIYDQRREVPTEKDEEEVLLFRHAVKEGKYCEVPVPVEKIVRWDLEKLFTIESFGFISGVRVKVFAPNSMRDGILSINSDSDIPEFDLFQAKDCFKGNIRLTEFDSVWEEIYQQGIFNKLSGFNEVNWIKKGPTGLNL